MKSVLLRWPASLGARTPEMTELARPSNNWKLQTRPLVKEGAPQQQIHNCLKTIKERGRRISRGCLTPRRTGRLIISRNTTLWVLLLTSLAAIAQYKVTSATSNRSATRRMNVTHAVGHEQAYCLLLQFIVSILWVLTTFSCGYAIQCNIILLPKPKRPASFDRVGSLPCSQKSTVDLRKSCDQVLK
jgi:hypothetical protein